MHWKERRLGLVFSVLLGQLRTKERITLIGPALEFVGRFVSVIVGKKLIDFESVLQ